MKPIYTLPKRNTRAKVIGAVVAGAIVVVVGVVFFRLGIAAAQHGAAPNSLSAPTATTDVAAQANAYIATVSRDSLSVRGDISLMSYACSAVDAANLSACKASIQTIARDTESFQDDLKSTPAPPCLHAADTALRHAFTLIQQGSQGATNGVNAQDASEVAQGMTLYSQASTQLMTVSNEIETTQC